MVSYSEVACSAHWMAMCRMLCTVRCGCTWAACVLLCWATRRPCSDVGGGRGRRGRRDGSESESEAARVYHKISCPGRNLSRLLSPSPATSTIPYPPHNKSTTGNRSATNLPLLLCHFLVIRLCRHFQKHLICPSPFSPAFIARSPFARRLSLSALKAFYRHLSLNAHPPSPPLPP